MPWQMRGRVVVNSIISLFIGVFGTILYAVQGGWQHGFTIFGVALLIAGGSLFSGGLFGFLFGIPRTLQEEKHDKIAENHDQKDVRAAKLRSPYQANTNLEQISDWLTKILVGVGLTQIPELERALGSYTEFVSAGLGGFQSSRVFAVAILIYFLVPGFIIGFLATRLYLPQAFRLAELAAVGAKIAEVESKVSELERQAALDAKALSVTQRQLNPQGDTLPLLQSDIIDALKPASTNTKAQVFYLSQAVRNENWSERRTKPKMERTIPIFRALIASDTDEIYHRNHGQLGYALKDQRQPKWKEAESELSKAIELRGPWQQHGWLLYEFNRAICRINCDEQFSQGKESSEDAKKNILADLIAAASLPELKELISSDPVLSAWISLNKIQWS